MSRQAELEEEFTAISHSEDSLRLTIASYAESGDQLGLLVGHRVLGKYLREQARFPEAIDEQQQGLSLALKLQDTLEIVRAYNNLGTCFRRIGAMPEASAYHFLALSYAEAFSQASQPGPGMKNVVIALNGLGNINLTLGHHANAEKYFRAALADERRMSSDLGQAINYANLGYVYEIRGQYDSAYHYYERSYHYNERAHSAVGMGLCYTHFGDLHKAKGEYAAARREYRRSYDLMEQVADRWHWLEACIALAEVSMLMKDNADFESYIAHAEKVAHEIDSPQHLAEIYRLEHTYYEQKGDYREALELYKKSTAMEDSLMGMKKHNSYLDMRVNFERRKHEGRLAELQALGDAERIKKKVLAYILVALTVVSLAIIVMLIYGVHTHTRAYSVLRRAERMRTDFFTNITHEFRTPLTVIQGFSRQLWHEEGLSQEERNSYFAAIERQSANVLHMVNRLLDFVMVGSASDEPEWKHGNIVLYLGMAVEPYKLYAQAYQQEIKFHSDFEQLDMDFVPFYIDRIVSNLLSNAIKHSSAGAITTVSLLKDEAKSDRVVLQVSDMGEGIAPDELDRIFELFYRGQHSANKKGSGIGLAFVQLMVERMNGTINVTSEVGKCTQISVSLPCRCRSHKMIPPLIDRGTMQAPQIDPNELAGMASSVSKAEIEKESNSECPLVLIVEDNDDIALYIESLLGCNYVVMRACDGSQGLELARQHIPDLVLMDVMMPCMDGYELCEAMQADMLVNHIPIIMLTARVSEQDHLEGLHRGAQAYITKPFSPEQLLLQVRNILAQQERLKAHYRLAAKGNNPSASTYGSLSEKTDGATDPAQAVKDLLTDSGIAMSNETLNFLNKVVELVHEHIDKPDLNPAMLAQLLHMSPSQLNRKLKGTTGMAPGSFIQEQRMRRAMFLLTETEMRVSEVAMEVGILDASYFARIFKKEFGITPTQAKEGHVPGAKGA